jgi:hypothetical protein
VAQKIKFNVAVDESLATAFRKASDHYYGRIGMCLAAAMLKFIELDPKEQTELLRRVFEIETDAEMATAVESAKEEQHRRISEREKKHKK